MFDGKSTNFDLRCIDFARGFLFDFFYAKNVLGLFLINTENWPGNSNDENVFTTLTCTNGPYNGCFAKTLPSIRTGQTNVSNAKK